MQENWKSSKYIPDGTQFLRKQFGPHAEFVLDRKLALANQDNMNWVLHNKTCHICELYFQGKLQ